MGFACSLGDKAGVVVEVLQPSLAAAIAWRSLEQIW